MVYVSVKKYIQSCTTTRARVAALESIIDLLLLQAAEIASGSTENITQYSLNDGQTIISTTYKGSKGVAAAILEWETLLQMYKNRLVGRKFTLRDGRNFY